MSAYVEVDLEAVKEQWLQLCVACDAGIGCCTHRRTDHRPVMTSMVAEIEWLRKDRELMARALRSFL